MGLFGLIILLIIVGVGLWLVNAYVPMAQSIKTILNVVVIIIAVLFVLQFFTGWFGAPMHYYHH